MNQYYSINVMLHLTKKCFPTLVHDDLYRAYLEALSSASVFGFGDYYYRGFSTDVSTKIYKVSTFKQYLTNIPLQDDTTDIVVSPQLYDDFTSDYEYAEYAQMLTDKNLNVISA